MEIKIKGTIKHYYRPSRMFKNKALDRPWMNLSRNSHTLLVTTQTTQKKFNFLTKLHAHLIWAKNFPF